MVYPTAVRYTFAVERYWKGPGASQVTVTDYDVGGECGRFFEKGVSYLVYARKDPDLDDPTALTADVCSRVWLAPRADEDLRILGKGHSPST